MTRVLSKTNADDKSDLSSVYADEPLEKIFTPERTSRVSFAAMYLGVTLTDLKSRYDPQIQTIGQLLEMTVQELRDGVLAGACINYIKAVLEDVGLSLAS